MFEIDRFVRSVLVHVTSRNYPLYIQLSRMFWTRIAKFYFTAFVYVLVGLRNMCQNNAVRNSSTDAIAYEIQFLNSSVLTNDEKEGSGWFSFGSRNTKVLNIDSHFDNSLWSFVQAGLSVWGVLKNDLSRMNSQLNWTVFFLNNTHSQILFE